MDEERIVVAGGGAAGFFAAITAAEAAPQKKVMLLEKSAQFLGKVRISGGGRCNVTHACFDERALAGRFPRGDRALIGPFHQFQAEDTVAWFAARGVKLKVEDDGRMFPVTDSSQTVIDCLVLAARQARVEMRTGQGVTAATREGNLFSLLLSDGSTLSCRRLLLATGGCRTAALGQLAVSLGHSLVAPVPSLFTFHVEAPWLRSLAGISVVLAEASVPGVLPPQRGPLLVTHWGLSGPAILRLSAWGARDLHGLNYQFPLRINWLPESTEESLAREWGTRRNRQPAKFVVNAPLAPIPSRLWEQLVLQAGIGPRTRWSELSRAAERSLSAGLLRTELPVSGKSLNKDEFVTCGGVPLGEVNFKTMESRVCPGLYFAGELLDVDGITGGFNFQAAWTTGWIAGRAMAGVGK